MTETTSGPSTWSSPNSTSFGCRRSPLDPELPELWATAVGASTATLTRPPPMAREADRARVEIVFFTGRDIIKLL